MTRKELREQTFKLLFRVEFQELSDMDAQADMFYEYLSEDKIPEDAEEVLSTEELCPEMLTVKPRLNSIISLLPEIDDKISSNMTGWTLDRVGKVELTILRLATYEICFDEDIPDSVAINEAVELAKKFGPDDSASFINAVLAKIEKNKQ